MAAARNGPGVPFAPPGSLAEQRSTAKPAPIHIPQATTMTETGKEPPDSPQRPPVSPITPVASFATLARENTVKPPPHPASATFAPPVPKDASVMPSPASTHMSNSSNSTPFNRHISFTSSDRAAQQQTPRSFAQGSVSQPQSAQSRSQFKDLPESAPQINYTAHPVPVSIPEADNTDAQALRAALAVLQIQRDKSTRDIKTLTTLKEAAAHDPQRFVDEMLAGNLGHKAAPGAVSDPLRPTLEEDYSDEEEDDDDDGDEGEEQNENEDKDETSQTKRLPKFPTRQNIVRCPPVNWAKYHVLGDSLDKLHDEQRRRPTPGEPGTGVIGSDWQGRDHIVAAPYSPWVDGLQHPMQTRRGSKKPL